MKQIVLLLLTAMAVVFCQAQTCKISANQNNGKVIQISVNLDSLKGQTLVTTINHQQGGNVNVQMAYEDTNAALPVDELREDSSAVAENNPEVNATASNPAAADEVNADAEHPEETPEDTPAENTEGSNSLTQSLTNAVGIGEIASLIGAFTHTNGEAYSEYAENFIVADTTKYQPVYKPRKWKWLKNCKSYLTAEFSGIFGKDFGDSDNSQEAEKITSDDYGTDPENEFNYGMSAKISQVFVPGFYDENGKFTPNRLNFAWSLGALVAMDWQKDFGWSYDFLAKVGIQAGEGITLGVDGLIGTGITPYAIYSTNSLDHRVIFHNQWCFKYGLQAWLSMNYGGSTYTSLFARIVHSVAPSSVYNHPTAKGWENTFVDFDNGSWQVGFAVGYTFGHHETLKDKRLIATLSTGVNLIEKNHEAEALIELEKFNNVSSTLDFIYGLGYGSSLGKNKLQSFTLGGGWRKKFSTNFSALAKMYAGIGEYMIEKHIADKEHLFNMTNAEVKQLCLKAGLQLSAGYQLGCWNLSVGLRGGYHFGKQPATEGYSTVEYKGLRGFELMPTFGASLNF